MMMKRRFVQGLLILALLCGAVLLAHPSVAWAMEGRGTQEAPYRISSAADLQEFAKLVNDGDTDACAVLTTDITINSNVLDEDGNLNESAADTFTQWTPIGNDYNYRYTGTFDGQGHTISGLYINSNAGYAGLFGCIGTNGTVQNLTLADSYISISSYGIDDAYVGGICGWNYDGSIENCSNSGTVSGSGNGIYVGGICGWNRGSITDCSNSGNVTSAVVGGICGENYGSITDCSNSGNVSSNGGISDDGYGYVGGICGENSYDSYSGIITTCYWLEGTAGAGIGDNSGGGEATEKTAAQFASGEVAWLLNGSSTNGPWRQNLSGPDKDVFPTLDPTHHIVICENNTYTNEHNYQNGFCTSCGSYESAVQDDAGTYQISNAGQLYWFAELVNGTLTDGTAKNTAACAVLTTDITINSNVLDKNGNLNGDGSNFTQWTPIGDYSKLYTGTFDGAGYSISGLYIDSDVKYAGLFGYIGTNGTVKNLALADSSINSSSEYSYVGGICGVNDDGSITSCSNNGDVTGSGDSSTVGGICGWNGGRIENCSNSGDVSDSGFNSKVGGICGWNDGGSITTCSNSGAVGGGSYVGGICGDNWDSITNCYWLSGTAGEGSGIGVGGGEATEKTTDQYASGEVAWLLNQWPGNAEVDGKVWAVGKDGYPVLNGKSDNIVVKLTFDTNTGNTADNRYQYANSGDTVTVPEAPTRSGYTFGGWYDNEALSGDPVTAISADATGDQTYWAKWTAETYSVKLNTNGGTINSGNITSYTYGIGATLPTDVTRSGYTFGGWYDNDALSGEPVTTISANATGDQTYWAKWTAKQTPPPTIPPTVSEKTIDAIADAQPGETVTVDLSSGSTKLDKEVFETLAGQDITLDIDLGDGVSWAVNGTDIPEDADFTDIDMGVTMNSDGIPVDVVNAITGERDSVQITLAHDGAFGFTMTLTAPLGEENAGYWANLYHFNEEASTMTFETAAPIGDDGSVSLSFNHASQYAIVIDDHNHGIVTLPFTDVSDSDWFYDPVCYVYSQGLMTGTSENTFEPNTPLSRAMLVAVLHRLEGSPAASAGDFSDVAANDWYATAVNWAASVGVVNGFDDGTFQPNAAITREQLAAILMNYAQYKGQDVSARATLDTYNDATAISSWANDVMSWAVAEGLLTGVTNDQLQPQGNATRAQVAAILERFLAE